MKKVKNIGIQLVLTLVLAGYLPSTLQAADFCVDDNSDGTANGADCDSDCTDGNANCSLRDAITASEATAGPNRIIFDIGAGGLQTITIDNAQGPLPTITQSLDIDGTTQGSFAGVPIIEIDGTNLAGFGNFGLRITAGNSTVRSLVIKNFPDTGIRIETNGNNAVYGCYIGLDADGSTAAGNYNGVEINDSSNNTVGGPGNNEGNVIGSNTFYGIRISQGTPDNNLIQGNLVGTDATGTLARRHNDTGVQISDGDNNQVGGDQPGEGNIISGNQKGIGAGSFQMEIIQGNFIGTDITGTVAIPNTFTGLVMSNSNTLVGGTTPGAGNIISGNSLFGILFSNVVGGFTIQGNLIGTDVTGTQALPNGGPGIQVQDINNSTIGGTDPGATNVISGNTENGISVVGSNTGPNIMIQNNFIGTDINGTAPLPNGENGIEISNNSSFDVVDIFVGGEEENAGNVIAFNTLAGVKLSDVSTEDLREISILTNSIFSNGALGISIDSGLNNGILPPTLTSVFNYGDSSVVTGQLNGQANTNYLIQVFSNPALDPSGFGEGQFFVGQDTVTTDAGGTANFEVSLQITSQNGLLVMGNGDLVIKSGALPGEFVTTTATDPAGNTSEFSNGLEIMAGASLQFSAPTYSINEDGGMVTITVVRTGDMGEAESVDFATMDGTATAGTNYQAVQTTLNFAAGVMSQQVDIPILNQDMNTSLTVLLSLTNPSEGTRVGDPGDALLTIIGVGTQGNGGGMGTEGDGGGFGTEQNAGGCSLNLRPRGHAWLIVFLPAALLIFLRIRHPNQVRRKGS